MRRGGAYGPAESEAMDLRELGYLLRRGRRWIVGGALLGLLAGAAVLWLVEPRYKATASVLLRNQVQGASSGISELSELLGNLPISLGGSGVETEMAILTSRSVLGEVVDSLGMAVRITEPAGLAPLNLFDQVRADPYARDVEYRFERREGGYRVEWAGGSATAVPGSLVTLPEAQLVLGRGALPAQFGIRVRDRESAIDALQDVLRTDVLGGEVVEIVYRSTSRELAAAVPNAVIRRYLERRRTTDRGVNQYRYEFLRDHVDSIAIQLAAAEAALRRQQEGSGLFSPDLAAETGLRRVADLRAELERGEVESRALQGILAKAPQGNLSPQELAAYPSFIGNPAINGLLSRLLDLETQRVLLLERRPPHDPEVVPLTQSIEHLESRLVTISRDYLQGLLRRAVEIRSELERHQGEMARLPATAEVSFRLEREVRRLSETLVAMQTQLVAARLAAISEGGDVRQVDVAIAPQDSTFPAPVLSLLGGLLGGLFFGTVAAVGAGRLRRRIYNTAEAEIATGIPTLSFGAQVPLSFPEVSGSRRLLVIPVDPAADVVAVGERIATTAALQGREAVLANLTDEGAVISPSRFGDHVPVGRIVAADGRSGHSPAAAERCAIYPAQTNGQASWRSTLATLEETASLVVAALPSALDASTVAMLGPDGLVVIVARTGVTREKLQDTIDACTQMGATVLRIVLQPSPRGR
jgi:uncharacterized protein involved in exopolysaccharide biosynthesis